MKASDFIKKHAPRNKQTSPLWRYKDDIQSLHDDRYSSEVIRQFLAKNGVKVSAARVRAFLKEINALSSGSEHPKLPATHGLPTATSTVISDHEEVGNVTNNQSPKTGEGVSSHSGEPTSDQMQEFFRLQRIGRSSK